MISQPDALAASQRIWRTSKFTYGMGLLIPKRSRPLFWAWYVYLRWVDDSVDDTICTELGRTAYLRRQMMLLSRGAEGQELTLSFEERLLSELVHHDFNNAGSLRTHINDMLESIKFDAERGGRPFQHAALHENYRREVSSYLSSLAYFCGMENISPPIGFEAAIAAKTAHIIRDFVKDAHLGHLNISNEDLAAYQLDCGKIDTSTNSHALVTWVAAQVRLAERLIVRGRDAAQESSNFRYKVILACLIAKYECYLRDIRANHFDPQSPPRLRVRCFVQKAAKNCAAIFYQNKRPLRREVVFPPVVRLSPWSKLRFLLDLFPAVDCKGLADLYTTLQQPASLLIDDRPRMDRRFRAGYWLGRSSFRAIAPVLASDTSLSHIAGLLVAYWGLSAIELDRLQDESVLPAPEILHLSHRWLDALLAATDSNKPLQFLNIPREHPSSIFALLSDRFMILVREICTASPGHSSNAQVATARVSFYRHAESLMRGQMASMSQTDLDAPKDWSWYFREIMNRKNVEFLLTPFRLWCMEDGSDMRFARVASSFLLLNRAYLHYQLLDDLADANEDIRQKVIAAPGFVLLSQASLGRLYVELSEVGSFTTRHRSDRIDAVRLTSAVHRSDLLCPEFIGPRLFDDFRHLLLRDDTSEGLYACLEVAVRCAISNTEAELRLPLHELAAQRCRQGAAYLSALRNHDVEAARRNLLDSNVPSRILSAVHEESAIVAVRNALSKIDDPAHIRILYIMERLMRSTLEAAASFAHGR